MRIHAFDHEPNPALPPPTISLDGRGNLESQQDKQPVNVRLVMVPGRSTMFICSAPGFREFSFPMGPLSGDRFLGRSYGIQGDLDGRPFRCADVWSSRESTTFVPPTRPAWEGVFLPHERVVLGGTVDEDTPVQSASFVLITYLGMRLAFSVDKWAYEIRVSRHVDGLRQQAEAWKAPLETAVLEVRPDVPASLSEVLSRTHHFLAMLSLLQGDHIRYNRYEVSTRDGEVLEVWDTRQVLGNPVLSQELRLAMHHQDYLAIALPYYLRMPAAQQDLLRLAMGYHLQAKKEQPLETAFVAEAVAWEMLANEGNSGNLLPHEAEELQRRLKCVYGQWQKDFPDSKDPDGIYKQRVYGALRWTPLREGVEQLLTRLGLRDALPLRSDGMPIDPLLLVKLRNGIMHEGRFPKGCSNREENRQVLQCLLQIGDLMLAKLLHPGLNAG